MTSFSRGEHQRPDADYVQRQFRDQPALGIWAILYFVLGAVAPAAA
jgi:hypothetical protein